MPLEGWSYRVEQAVVMGDGKARAVIQTVTVLWYGCGAAVPFDSCSAFLRRARKRRVGRSMARWMRGGRVLGEIDGE
jgi:hypothetical protein